MIVPDEQSVKKKMSHLGDWHDWIDRISFDSFEVVSLLMFWSKERYCAVKYPTWKDKLPDRSLIEGSAQEDSLVLDCALRLLNDEQINVQVGRELHAQLLKCAERAELAGLERTARDSGKLAKRLLIAMGGG